MRNCGENCLERIPTGPIQGVHFRRYPLYKGVYFREGFQEIRLKCIPVTAYLIRLLTSKLFVLSIKAGKLTQKKELSDASMSPVERVP